MQRRRIKRVIDAMRTQDRLIVHLDCGHTISYWRKDVEAASPIPGFLKAELDHADFAECTLCSTPDLPEREKEKSPLEDFHRWNNEPRTVR